MVDGGTGVAFTIDYAPPVAGTSGPWSVVRVSCPSIGANDSLR